MLASSASLWGQYSELPHYTGQGVTPAFEGWFPNSDGTFSILVGYYNRNLKEVVDIPIGPDNKIEPGGPDHGQPTHFLAGRGWGPFVVIVPKDFGDKEFTWTLTVNGQTNSIPINLKPLWEIAPFIDAINNTPPWLSFQPLDDNGPRIAGPKPLVITKTAKVGVPLVLTAYVADDDVFSPGRTAPANPVTTAWSLFRGPADATVKFDPEKPKVDKMELKAMPKAAVFAGKASTQVTFDEPGDYTLYLAVNDASGVGGGNGFQCCWTNGHVKVTVTK
ncbi:MAG TPA: hypothetical protein VG273_28415 [Bryobacteraceae bacterium]|nr:hypothetical protein [Bryobacteraceae bacterium]